MGEKRTDLLSLMAVVDEWGVFVGETVGSGCNEDKGGADVSQVVQGLPSGRNYKCCRGHDVLPVNSVAGETASMVLPQWSAL